MNCGRCTHWRLVGALGQHGYGTCAVRAEPWRAAVNTAGWSPCRLGKFTALVAAPAPAAPATESLF